MEVTNELSFRPATLDDLPILLDFEQGIIAAERPFDTTLAPNPIHYYDLEALIKSEDAEVMVAIVGEEVVGSGYANLKKSKPYLTQKYHAYLGFMFVKPEHRGKGINQGLTNELISWAKSKGLMEIILEVYDKNAPALRAYEKAGFTKNLVEMRLDIS
ncbi:MAG: GNAT family N-acetyltransferase [Cytophagales bacterium]|nr:GNAT family N-acetyltransferase [Cytophagales bacterium]